MSPAQLVRDFIGRISDVSVEGEDLWSREKVDSVLAGLGVSDYEFHFQPRVVFLNDLDDLYRVMDYAGKTELSDQCLMSLAKCKRKVCLHVGGWQFEAEDVRN